MTQGLKGIGKLYIFDKNKTDIGFFFFKKTVFLLNYTFCIYNILLIIIFLFLFYFIFFRFLEMILQHLHLGPSVCLNTTFLLENERIHD